MILSMLIEAEIIYIEAGLEKKKKLHKINIDQFCSESIHLRETARKRMRGEERSEREKCTDAADETLDC